MGKVEDFTNTSNHFETPDTSFSELSDLVFPVDYFKSFFNNELIQPQANQTNLYAIQRNREMFRSVYMR